MAVEVAAADRDDGQFRLNSRQEVTRRGRSTAVVRDLQDLSANRVGVYVAQSILDLARRITGEQHPEVAVLETEDEAIGVGRIRLLRLDPSRV